MHSFSVRRNKKNASCSMKSGSTWSDKNSDINVSIYECSDVLVYKESVLARSLLQEMLIGK